MTLEVKYNGDDASVGEELLIDVRMFEERVRMVEMAVNGGYFDLNEAQSLYNINEIEYVAYQLKSIWTESFDRENL